MKVVRAGWSSLSVSHLTSAVLVGEVAAKVSGCCCFRRICWENSFFTEYFFNENQNFCFSIATGDGETRMYSEQCFGMWRRCFPSQMHLSWKFKIIGVEPCDDDDDGDYYYYYFIKLQFFKNFSADPSPCSSTRGEPSLEKPAQDVLTAQLRKLSATK